VKNSVPLVYRCAGGTRPACARASGEYSDWPGGGGGGGGGFRGRRDGGRMEGTWLAAAGD